MELDKSKVINLHQHSFFSVLDSPATLEDIVKSAKDYGRVAASLTDHGTIEGCVPFYVECKNQGIKPILGQEFYITSEGRKLTDRDPQLDKKRHHLLILAKNEKGYKNLCKLSSIANIEGMYYKPRIDFETLAKYKEGLIISSACYASQLSYYLSDEYAEENKDGLEKAEKYLLKMKAEFGEDFYIEEVWLRPTGKENPTDYNIITGKKAEPIYIRQEKVNKKATELSKKLGIKRIMTLDAHYVKSEDSEIQDMLVAIGTGRDLDDSARLTFIDIDESILSPDEMIKEAEKRNDLDLVKNITEIVDKIDINLSFVGERHIPIFPVPEEELKTFTEEQKKNPEKEYIRRQVFEGIKKRNYRNFNKTGKLDQKIIDRIQHELKVIDQMGFNGYHLIVADYNNWAKDNGVVCGPARGSAASSLVCYLLGITEVDPMEYEDLMLFMRYLNPHRVSMPDIDLDYSDRQKVEDYFREKWGHDKTAAISTTSYMRAKNAFKDVARTLRFDFKESNRIAGLIPDAEAKDRKKKRLPILLEENEELKKEASKNPEVGKIFNYAKKLEGTVRGHGVHACGVVIAPHALTDYMGLTVAKGKDGRIVTQADPADIEENYGLLKMDMLGLSNLTILEETIQKIKKEYGKDINIKDIPLDDEKTYKTYQDGNSYFTFQTNTSYLRQICKEFKPKNIRDLAWINAVCRPGPMSYIPEMLEIRQGKRKPTYICEAAKEIFEPLGGYPVFQESIMLFCMKACGFDEAEADNIRKAIGKSKPEILQEYKDKVIKGYLKHTNPNQKKEIEEFWNTVEGFGRYAFNACFSGDTKILRTSKNDRDDLPIEEMFKIKNDKEYAISSGRIPLHKKYNLYGYGKSYSINENNRLVVNEIEDIIDAGERDVYRLTLENGYCVDLTKEHKIQTHEGLKELQKIEKTDFVYCKQKRVSLKYNKLFNKNIRHDYIVNIPGKGHQGFVKTLKNPKKFNFTMYKETCLNAKLPCSECGKAFTEYKPDFHDFELHHVDGDAENDAISNFKWLCNGCHKKAHYELLNRTKRDELEQPATLSKVSRVEYLGRKHVYSVHMKEPYHTLAVNDGIIASNSHAVAYSHISYWTCYFLTHYPEIYLASYMNNRADDRDEIAACINYCKKFGIKVKTPDINYSTRNFRADPENHTIYYGLSKIKGLGASAWDIVVERNANGEYKSIEDLIERIPRRTLNSGKLTALLYGGALDSFVKGKRSILDASYENILEYQNNYFKNSSKKSKVSKNQIALFDELFEDNTNKIRLVIPEEFTEDMKINLLLKEKEYLGEYITASPLDSYKRNEDWINEIERDKKKKEEFESQGSRYYGENVQKIIGIVQSIKALTTKKGDRMAIVQLDCNENSVELVVFPKVYAGLRKIPKTGNIVMFSGSYNEGDYESGYKMFAESLKIIR